MPPTLRFTSPPSRTETVYYSLQQKTPAYVDCGESVELLSSDLGDEDIKAALRLAMKKFGKPFVQGGDPDNPGSLVHVALLAGEIGVELANPQLKAICARARAVAEKTATAPGI